MLHVQQRIQFCKAGRLGLQFFLLRKRLGDFNLCGLLLLFQRIQCGISIGNAVGKIADGIVQTDDVAARVIAQRYRITQLAAENDLMLILETVKANVSFFSFTSSVFRVFSICFTVKCSPDCSLASAMAFSISSI